VALVRYETLRDRKTGELLDARCAADVAQRPFGGLDKTTYVHAVENLDPDAVRKALGLKPLWDESGIAADAAASNMRAELMAAGLSAADVTLISTGKVGVAEMKALLAKAAPVAKEL